MKKYLVALDLSTKTGYALFELNNDHPMDAMAAKLVDYKTLIAEKYDNATYPRDYMYRAENVATIIFDEIFKLDLGPDTYLAFVIEETNGSKSRYTQKLLEFIHFAVLQMLDNHSWEVNYVNTSDWRKVLGIELTAEQKKKNKELSKAKSKAKSKGEKLDKKKLGINGKVTKKHVAIAKANELFNLSLKQKDNDQADAICLGYAYLLGVETACPPTK